MHINGSLEDIVANNGDSSEEFTELLDAAHVNPFATWESVRDGLASDPRYLALSTDRKRREVFKTWAQTRQEETASSGDPLDSRKKYVKYLHQKYRPGVPYPLFKRTARTDPEFASAALAESEKAQLYREYALYAKLTPAERPQFVGEHPPFAAL